MSYQFVNAVISFCTSVTEYNLIPPIDHIKLAHVQVHQTCNQVLHDNDGLDGDVVDSVASKYNFKVVQSKVTQQLYRVFTDTFTHFLWVYEVQLYIQAFKTHQAIITHIRIGVIA